MRVTTNAGRPSARPYTFTQAVGLSENNLRFLLEAKADGVSVTRAATLGRQSLLLDADALHEILESFGHQLSAPDCIDLVQLDGGFAEPLFRFLGSEAVKSFDASRYEGATDVHDFNTPIPSEHYQQFDLVLDAGSLEHVFLAPTALRNCMEMVSIGGHFIAMSPANNYFGHGFYQFSPEFYYRSLTPENGFELLRVSAFEGHADPVWHDVLDPASVKHRVGALTRRPTTIAVLARRVADIPMFAHVPQESDYASMWVSEDDDPAPTLGERRMGLAERARPYAREGIRQLYRRARAVLSRRRYDPAVFRSRPVPRRDPPSRAGR